MLPSSLAPSSPEPEGAQGLSAAEWIDTCWLNHTAEHCPVKQQPAGPPHQREWRGKASQEYILCKEISRQRRMYGDRPRDAVLSAVSLTLRRNEDSGT